MTDPRRREPARKRPPRHAEGPSPELLEAMNHWYPGHEFPPAGSGLLSVLADLSTLARAGRDSPHAWRMQAESAATEWERAHVDWVRCQWAVARRQAPGSVLEAALQALSPWLSGPPYLRWLDRVQRLAWLPATTSRATQTRLEPLLREAAVIAWLEEEVGGSRLPNGLADDRPRPAENA